jgi:hypothetical protein
VKKEAHGPLCQLVELLGELLQIGLSILEKGLVLLVLDVELQAGRRQQRGQRRGKTREYSCLPLSRTSTSVRGGTVALPKQGQQTQAVSNKEGMLDLNHELDGLVQEFDALEVHACNDKGQKPSSPARQQNAPSLTSSFILAVVVSRCFCENCRLWLWLK